MMMSMVTDEPPYENPRITQAPVQVLPSRLPSRLLTSKIKVLLALSLPKCFVCGERGEKLACRSQA